MTLAALVIFLSGISMAQAPSGAETNLPTAPSALIGAEPGVHVAPAEAASVRGTVLDSGGALIPGAKVEVADTAHEDTRTVLAGDDGAFEVDSLKPGEPYVVRVSAEGETPWTSERIVLQPGEAMTLNNIRLKVEISDSITVSASREQIATAQVQMETQQRMFGFIPNFYTVYDGDDASPLTSKLKFKLAMRTSFDPVTMAGIAFVAGVKQAAGTPHYQGGAAGYGQRLGATTATGLADILIGGAILPSLLHQDPRYFYQGTGTKKSRLMHALSSSVLTRGDDGRYHFNYSSIGGDLSTSALQLTYYPQSDRNAGTFATQFALATGERTLNTVAQEFLFSRFTKKAKFHADSDDGALSTLPAQEPKHKPVQAMKRLFHPVHLSGGEM